ncbi:MAG: Smr/MutS family protein [Alphaproteobacteria bacterium]|nr:Smr/MutS family protein [Alphaproteobacteria bacterium]
MTPLQCGDFTQVDRATAARVRRGEYPISARLDLHGLTREEAQDALTESVFAAAERGERCLLVITGKGGPGGEGVLRQLLPVWLNLDALRPLVLAFDVAQPRHGGGGAFYVLLRRRRDDQW